MNQVFMNLLKNAVQAIDGRGTITIRTRVDGGRVRLAFADTGPGIPPEHLGRVFDPGFTTKGVGVGTGLGLSIASQIMAAHGGRIAVESAVGKGSTFTLELPLRANEELGGGRR
jgi:two-component system NtrC family sensor kinase